MKRYLLALVAILLFATSALASGIYQPVARGTVAAADIAVTLTDGSADVDLSSATIPRNYKGHLLKIYDVNNVCIQGFVSTDGAGNVQNIVSTKGGTTRNWAKKGTGFDDTTNCRYEIYKVLQAPVIATSNILAGNALIDATDDNAFAAPIGIDFTPYQDGRHILAMYDASGYAALAWISATAPSGEALSTEKFTDPDFDNPASWTIQTGWDISGGKLTATTALNTTVFAYPSQSAGMLLKLALTSDVLTGGTYQGFVNGVPVAAAVNTVGQTYWYGTRVWSNTCGIKATTSLSASFTDISLKQVTMPAATGALLLSTKGGSRGWIYKHASFNPNAAITAKVLFAGD